MKVVKYIKLLIATNVEEFINKKKKGYLLIEVVVGFALLSIISVCIFSAFDMGINIEKKSNDSYDEYSVLYAVKKECLNNMSISNFKNSKKVLAKDFIKADSKLHNIFDINGIYIDISSENLNGNIDIKIFKEMEFISFRRNSCVDI